MFFVSAEFSTFNPSPVLLLAVEAQEMKKSGRGKTKRQALRAETFKPLMRDGFRL